MVQEGGQECRGQRGRLCPVQTMTPRERNKMDRRTHRFHLVRRHPRRPIAVILIDTQSRVRLGIGFRYPPPPLSFPTPGKTVPHHPLGDGHQVTVPHPPLGDHTPRAGRGGEGARGSERRRTGARLCKTVLPSRS